MLGLQAGRITQTTRRSQIREKEIRNTGKGEDYVFSNGSLLEGGRMGGGAFIVKRGGTEEDVECGIGDVARVWDGEVAGMAEGLTRLSYNEGTIRERKVGKVLMLADSRAAIAAVQKASRTGGAGSRHLQKVLHEIAEIRDNRSGRRD